jgi:hypothetical protein
MPGRFEVQADEISNLNEQNFVRVCNTLLRHEGRRLGVPQEDILTTLRINDPDGGIDAVTRVHANGIFIRAGETVWQYKVSYPDSIPELEEALRNSAPAQAAFARGAGYTLVVGAGMPANLQESRQRSLQEALRRVKCEGEVVLLVADHVAHWVASVPAALLVLHPELGEYLNVEIVLRDARHSVMFHADDQRDALIATMEQLFVGPDPPSAYLRNRGSCWSWQDSPCPRGAGAAQHR